MLRCCRRERSDQRCVGRHERRPSPLRHHHHQHHQQQSQQHHLKAPGCYHCVWPDNDDDDDSVPIPVVCECEPGSVAAAAVAAAAAADSPSSSPDGVDRRPAQHDVIVNSRHDYHSDVIALTDVLAPEHLRQCCSWPEDAPAERLTDLRSC